MKFLITDDGKNNGTDQHLSSFNSPDEFKSDYLSRQK